MVGWVVVRNFPVLTGQEKSDWLGFAGTNPKLQKFDGYFAAVSIASSDPVLHDEQGNLIPLSERFAGQAPLYRGDSFCVKFEGLQRIHVA